MTSQPGFRAAEAVDGSQSRSCGQMGKGGNHPHPPVDQCQWKMPGKIGNTCPRARLRGQVYMRWQPHPCLSFSTESAREDGSPQGFPRAAAPVGVFSRGTTRISGSLSCGAREVRSPQNPPFASSGKQASPLPGYNLNGCCCVLIVKGQTPNGS